MMWTELFVFVISSHLWQSSHGYLSDVTNVLFSGSKNGVVAAFGNFNADKLTDIFVLADSGKTIYLLQAKEDVTKERAGFERILLLSLNTEKGEENNYITSLAPGDFDGDAQMDIMITKRKDGTTDPVTVQILWGNAIHNYLDPNPLTISETLKDQPSIIDMNGDMIPDLIGENSTSGERLYYVFRNRTYTTEKMMNGTSSTFDPLHVPQSSAFFDFDGDLVPDLCVVSEKDGRLQFEIWLNKAGILTWSQTIVSPPDFKKFGRPSFYDLNDNQEMNIILPGCLNEGEGCSLSVIYVYGRGEWHDMYTNFGHGDDGWQLSIKDFPMKSVDVPMSLRIGDFNLDGYPDALAVLKSNNNESYAPFLLQNVGSTTNFSRGFHIDLAQPLTRTRNTPLVAAFYDFMENGILDVILTVFVDGPQAELQALEQDFTADAYFLKVMVVSGRCVECPHGHQPYGVNQVGPVIRFQTTTSEGKSEIGVSSQLSQSAYFSLQLPFEVFGLGQTPNFVDVLEVGIQNPPNTAKRQRSWPSIIPNAQVVVIPYTNDNPSGWRTKLYVTPSRLVLLAGVALLGTCGFIAIVIAFLHWRERAEDKKEKLQEAQKFHFDAM